MSQPPRRRASVARDIYKALRQDIASGFYGGGEELLESDIAARFGVSRTPIREALIRLEGDGLVQMTHNRSAVVPHVTARDVLDVLELRLAVESYAIEHHGAQIDRATLEGLLGGYESAPTESEQTPEAMLYTSDTPLHRAIVDALGNSPVVEFIRSQDVRLAQLRALVWRLNNPTIDALMERRALESGEEHAEIISTLLAGDYVAARRALIEHFNSARDHLLQVLSILNALPAKKVSSKT